MVPQASLNFLQTMVLDSWWSQAYAHLVEPRSKCPSSPVA